MAPGVLAVLYSANAYASSVPSGIRLTLHNRNDFEGRLLYQVKIGCRRHQSTRPYSYKVIFNQHMNDEAGAFQRRLFPD